MRRPSGKISKSKLDDPNSEKSADKRVIPYSSNSSGDIALWKSFTNPSLKRSMYRPKEQIAEHLQHARNMNIYEYWNYQIKCRETGGFDVSGCTGTVTGGIANLSLKDWYYMAVGKEAAKFAVRKHNQMEAERATKNPQHQPSTLRFLEVARLNGQVVSGTMFYITLWARDMKNCQEKLYRAKVWRKILDKGHQLESFEEAPASELSNPALARKAPDEPEDLLEEIEEVNPEDSNGECSEQRTLESGTRAKRPFNALVEEIRRSPDFFQAGYFDIMNYAKKKWKTLSDEEKAAYGKA